MTNKEIAERLREIAGYDKPTHRVVRRDLRELADALDPPKPEPGTVVWWRPTGTDEWRLGVIVDYGIVPTDCINACWPWAINELEYKPARIIAPDEVAVTVPPVSEWPSGASAIKLVYETDYIGTTYITDVITRAEAEEMEAER